MKHVVTYSMGICSAFIAVRLQETCQAPVCLFSDTKREDEDTYRFGREVAERWGLNVAEASCGEDLWDWFRRNKMIPARQISPCSIQFKILPRVAYLEAQTEPCTVWYGFDPDEEDRFERLVEQWTHPEHTPRAMLIEEGISKKRCFGFFAQYGIKPPRVYRHMQHANCMPCKNWREKDYVACQYHYPDIFAAARKLEDEDGLKWMQDGPYLRDLPVLPSPPSRKKRRKLAGDTPEFSFDMPCGACALD